MLWRVSSLFIIINENGIYSQKLLILKERISDDTLFNWLSKFTDLKPSISTTDRSFREKINLYYIVVFLWTSTD